MTTDWRGFIPRPERKRETQTMWQPIETAPKDGTEILAWDGASRAVIYWRVGITSEWNLAVAGSYSEDTRFEPTHWMVLPAAPGGCCMNYRNPEYLAGLAPVELRTLLFDGKISINETRRALKLAPIDGRQFDLRYGELSDPQSDEDAA